MTTAIYNELVRPWLTNGAKGLLTVPEEDGRTLELTAFPEGSTVVVFSRVAPEDGANLCGFDQYGTFSLTTQRFKGSAHNAYDDADQDRAQAQAIREQVLELAEEALAEITPRQIIQMHSDAKDGDLNGKSFGKLQAAMIRGVSLDDSFTQDLREEMQNIRERLQFTPNMEEASANPDYIRNSASDLVKTATRPYWLFRLQPVMPAFAFAEKYPDYTADDITKGLREDEAASFRRILAIAEAVRASDGPVKFHVNGCAVTAVVSLPTEQAIDLLQDYAETHAVSLPQRSIINVDGLDIEVPVKFHVNGRPVTTVVSLPAEQAIDLLQDSAETHAVSPPQRSIVNVDGFDIEVGDGTVAEIDGQTFPL